MNDALHRKMSDSVSQTTTEWNECWKNIEFILERVPKTYAKDLKRAKVLGDRMQRKLNGVEEALRDNINDFSNDIEYLSSTSKDTTETDKERMREIMDKVNEMVATDPDILQRKEELIRELSITQEDLDKVISIIR